jgi:hypothetical protein
VAGEFTVPLVDAIASSGPTCANSCRRRSRFVGGASTVALTVSAPDAGAIPYAK